MNDLSNNVYSYYTTHFAELPVDKQLHFASRLSLWSGDAFGREALDQLRAGVTADEQPVEALRKVYQAAQESIHHGSKNASEIRAPYFAHYPRLRGIVMVLFRLTFMQTVYGIDARDEFWKLYDRSELDDLQRQLLADQGALAILSTHAINFLYLYNRVLLADDSTLDPAQFLTVGRSDQYDFNDPIHLQLYIYLYTHCIIGESQFYARALPANFQSSYLAMLDELESVIDEHFTAINLDNKFEFLVCCKLLGRSSKLEGRIEDEAQRSVSPDGTFLVDQHNTNPQTTNNTLDLSEHRNVLYIMSHRPFTAGRG